MQLDIPEVRQTQTPNHAVSETNDRLNKLKFKELFAISPLTASTALKSHQGCDAISDEEDNKASDGGWIKPMSDLLKFGGNDKTQRASIKTADRVSNNTHRVSGKKPEQSEGWTTLSSQIHNLKISGANEAQRDNITRRQTVPKKLISLKSINSTKHINQEGKVGTTLAMPGQRQSIRPTLGLSKPSFGIRKTLTSYNSAFMNDK